MASAAAGPRAPRARAGPPSAPSKRTPATATSWRRLHEVLLEAHLGPVDQLQPGAERIVGDRHQVDAHPERAGQLRGDLAQGGALAQPLGPVAVGGQVLVAEVEPGDPAEPFERLHDPPRLAGQAPPGLGVDGVGQGVHHRVQVGRDVQPVQDGVVAGVDDGGDLVRRHRLHHAPQQPGRPHASGQGGDHRDRVTGRRVGVAIGAGYPARPRCRRPCVERCARLAGCRRSDLPPRARAGCPWGSMPPRCSVARPASGRSAPGPWPACPRWTGVERLGLSPSAGAGGRASPPSFHPVCRPGSGPCRPARSMPRGGGPPPPGRVVHRSPRRGPRVQLRGAADPGGGPGGDGPRPHRRPLPRALRPAHPPYPELIRRAVAEGAWIHTPSQFVADQVVAELSVDPARVRAVHHGIPPAPDHPGGDGGRRRPLTLPDGCRRYVLAIGTIEPRKDYPLLVSAFAAVAAAHPDVALVVVGADGWGAERFAAAVEASPARARIVRPGYLDDRSLDAVLRRASVLAYPSRYEGFGFPPLQAMAAGVPVVATAAGAIPEVVGDGALLVGAGRRRRPGRRPGAGARRWRTPGGAGGAGPAAQRPVQLDGLCRGPGRPVPATCRHRDRAPPMGRGRSSNVRAADDGRAAPADGLGRHRHLRPRPGSRASTSWARLERPELELVASRPARRAAAARSAGRPGLPGPQLPAPRARC